MNKKEALRVLKEHTQYYVPTADLEALEIAIEALEGEVKKEEKVTCNSEETKTVHVISWLDSKDLVAAVDSKEKAMDWVKESKGEYMYTPLKVR